MTILLKLAFSDIFTHKKRTLLQIVGLVLSVALLLLGYSFLSSIDYVVREELRQDYILQDFGEDIEKLIDYNTGYISVRAIGLVIIGLIIYSSVSLISSSFIIGYGERQKLLGLLSSIGTSRFQLLIILIIQSFFIIILSVTLGIVLGYKLSWFCIVQFYDVLNTYVPHINTSFFIISREIFIKTVFISVVTVIIMSLLPIIKSKKAEIITSLRISNGIRISLKKNLFIDFFEHVFGFIGTLSAKNYNNNKLSFRALSVSLSSGMIAYTTTACLHAYSLQTFSLDTTEQLIAENRVVEVVYMFTLIVCVICVVNGFIVIISNINGRAREFSIFRSLGLNNFMINNMICIECIYYGLYTFLYGLLGSFFVDLFIYFSIQSQHKYFIYPIKPFLISFIVIFSFVIVMMIYMIIRMRKVDIIPSIKTNE